MPVFTIAFGTAEGTIVEPQSGDTIPVPVQPAPLEGVAEETGGAAYEAATGTELADAYERIQDSLGETLGEEIEMTTELTWRWARRSPSACWRSPGRSPSGGSADGLTAQSSIDRSVSTVLTGSGPTGLTDRCVTPASR